MKTLLLISGILSSFTLFSQEKSNYVKYVDGYRNLLEQITTSEYSNGFIQEAISEGVLTSKTTPLLQRLSDTSFFKELSGGFSTHTFKNKACNVLYKIKYHDNLYKNLYLDFVYKDNKLIYAKLECQDDGIGNILYQRIEYYRGLEVVYSTKTQTPKDETLLPRLNIELFTKGMEFLSWEINL